MGMSHDFEVAIEEGSTCVRVGTAIFWERTSINHGGLRGHGVSLCISEIRVLCVLRG